MFFKENNIYLIRSHLIILYICTIMNGIFSIELKKTKSSNYQAVVSLMTGLPNYSFKNDCHSIWIADIKEFIKYQRVIDYVIKIIIRWKSCEVRLYGQKLTSDYYGNIINEHCGKYGEMFQYNSFIGYEDLPLPFVFYPENTIGAFLGFSEDIDTEIYFCECQRKSIENYILLRQQPSDVRFEGPRSNPLGSESFPSKVSEESLNWLDSPYNHIHFKEGICFRCNNTMPRRDFTMTGSEFLKKYGWYVMAEYFNLGIDQFRRTVLPHNSDVEIFCLMKDYFEQEKVCSKKITEIMSSDMSQGKRAFVCIL